MSKFTKRVSDELNNAAVRMHFAGEKVAGKAGIKVAHGLSALLLGRYWEPCDDDCGCDHETER